MATITLKGEATETSGELPAVGSTAPDFNLVDGDLAEVTLAKFSGKKKILNLVPSLDTPVCSTSAREFNRNVGALNGVVVLNISADLPFAAKRVCEGYTLDRIVPLSIYRSPSFAQDYGVEITTGVLAGLLSRAIVVLDENNTVLYTEQVPEIAQEPDYDAALKAIA